MVFFFKGGGTFIFPLEFCEKDLPTYIKTEELRKNYLLIRYFWPPKLIYMYNVVE